MKRVNFLFCLMLFFLAACTQIASAKNHGPEDQFVSFSDIHFDPFSGCSTSIRSCPLVNKLRNTDYHQWDAIFEQYGAQKIAGKTEDANYPLLQLTLNELQRVNETEHLKFAVMPGDFLVHDFRLKFVLYSKDLSSADFRAFVNKTLQYLTYKIRVALPNIDLYPALGNNDSYTGDYNVVPNGEFLQDTANTWSDFFLNKENRSSFLRSFPRAGYYSVVVPHNKSQRVIVLNTMLFSVKAKKRIIAAAAEQELVWLQQQLTAAAKSNQHVILVFHIPAGIDMYATMQNHFSYVIEYWQQPYSQIFQSEMKNFANEITAILPAHIHIDSFRFISLRRIADVPVIFTPSISPIFGNSPAFKVFKYDANTFHILGYTTYTLNEDGRWQKR